MTSFSNHDNDMLFWGGQDTKGPDFRIKFIRFKIHLVLFDVFNILPYCLIQSSFNFARDRVNKTKFKSSMSVG